MKKEEKIKQRKSKNEKERKRKLTYIIVINRYQHHVVVCNDLIQYRCKTSVIFRTVPILNNSD